MGKCSSGLQESMFPASADVQPLLGHKPHLRMHRRERLSGRAGARTADQLVQAAGNHAVLRAVNQVLGTQEPLIRAAHHKRPW